MIDQLVKGGGHIHQLLFPVGLPTITPNRGLLRNHSVYESQEAGLGDILQVEPFHMSPLVGLRYWGTI
jgi:hypothetical protein